VLHNAAHIRSIASFTWCLTLTRLSSFPISVFSDGLKGSCGVRSNVNTPHKVKILSSTIKIIDSNNKEYIAKTNSNSGYIHIYKQGVVITDDFKAYIGKVQLDDGTIIDIPPLSFKKNVYVESYNPVTDTINAGARTKRLFNGTVEDYKKQKK